MSGSILWNHEVPYFSFLYLHLPLLKLTISVRLETQFKIWIFSFQSLQMYCYWQELISKLAPASLCHLKAVPKTWQRELDINLTVQPEQIMALGKKKKKKKPKATLKLYLKKCYITSAYLTCFSTQILTGMLEGIISFLFLFCAE